MSSAFPPVVQTELRAIAELAEHRLAAWFDAPVLGSHSTIYDGYPYLFQGAFPGVEAPAFRMLALAGKLFANAMFIYDNLMDGKPGNAAVNTLRVQAFQAEGYRALVDLFPADSPFWPAFQATLAEYVRACQDEQSFTGRETPWSEYTLERAMRIAQGKTALAQASILGLAALAGDQGPVEPLLASIRHYYVGRQIWDDVGDWKEDLASGTPSLLLVGLFPDGAPRSLDAAERATATRALYYDGHLERVLALAEAQLERAAACAAPWPELGWHRVVRKVQADCAALRLDVASIVAANHARAACQPRMDIVLPEPVTPWERLAVPALAALLKDWRSGFGEARHLMRLSASEGFGGASEFHSGDTFQRALIADALCDAPESLRHALEPLLAFEVDHLLQQRTEETPGGWKYFPTVAELAPDADDLGQVLQVLVRTGRIEEARRFVEEPLETLLCDRSLPDGSFETWIVPQPPRTELQRIQAEFNATKWGVGPDLEVVANLLYALHLYDAERFRERIDEALPYVLGCQQADGSWSSRWYVGPYYGTYVALRLLATVGGSGEALQRGKAYLRSTQHADGGWGLEATSDPLSTALALLGLAAGGVDATDTSRGDRARAWLDMARSPQGTWEAVPFIRPRMGEHYLARSMTHLYLLKASLAWGAGLESDAEPVLAGGMHV